MANIILRVGDEDKVSYEMEAKVAGVSLSEWIRRLANAACGRVTEVQVPITPGVDVVVEPVVAPASERMVAFDITKGEVTVEPIAGVGAGKMRAYDPNGGPVTYEPVPGVPEASKQKATVAKGGEGRTAPVKPYTYVRSHHPRCPCLMCTGKPEKKDVEPAKAVTLQEGEKVYTGEVTRFQGRTLYEIDTDKGKRWTAAPPPEQGKIPG